ncbi:hypothetical protein ABPG72_010464 [Tetrahymena utriculariae]
MSEYFRKYIKKEHYPVHPSSIKFKTSFKNCILESMKRRQWKEAEFDDWDLNWAEKEWILDVMDHAHVSSNQRVNHFRNFSELCRKDLLIKNIKKYKKTLEKENKLEEAALYNFTPLTYNLPSEYSIFCEEFKKVNSMSDSKQLWIMKPIGKAQGKGIFLFRNIKEIGNWKNTYRYNPDNPQADPYVVQKYIADPLLIGGKKFDMRIYALCVSYQPLTIYLYRTGFARFTHHRYDLEDISNAYVHLTNVAIQKTSENYDEKLGGKWLLQTLKLYLISKYGQEKVSEAFYQIQQIIIKALQAVQKVMINDKRCFELYGFDILFDAYLKPWLLEVNASPSMTANTAIDNELKISVLDDAFTIIDIERILTGQEEQIGGFDLIFKGNQIKLPQNSTYSSLLGCYNNRNQQLKKLAKSTAIRLAQQYAEQQQQQQQQQQLLLQQQKQNDLNKQRSSSKGPQQNFNQTFKNNQPIKSGYSRYNAAKAGPNKLIKKVVLNQGGSSTPLQSQQGQQNLLQPQQQPTSQIISNTGGVKIGQNQNNNINNTTNTSQLSSQASQQSTSQSSQQSSSQNQINQVRKQTQPQQSNIPKQANSQLNPNSGQMMMMVNPSNNNMNINQKLNQYNDDKNNDKFQRYFKEEEKYMELLKGQHRDEE